MRLSFPIGTVLLVCCLAASAAAQTSTTRTQASLSVRSPSQMEQADADVVAVHESSIARAAAFYDFTLDSSWSYEQTVCPLAPQEVILNYHSRQAHGVSSFSAVVPRQGSVIRIVPLVHDGTAPSVVPWGQHSYNVFNAITAGSGGVRQVSSDRFQRLAQEHNPGDKFVWGLCYVALVNERAVVPHPDRELHVFSATEPTFRIGNEGGSELSFTVRDDSRYYSVWELEFSPKGALIRADRDQHMLPTEDLETAGFVVPDGGPSGSFEPGAAVSPSSQLVVSPGVVSNENSINAAPASAGTADAAPASANAVGTARAQDVQAPTENRAAVIPASAPPRRRGRAEKSDVHLVPESGPLIEHPIPDSGPLVTHPVPQS